MRREFGMPNPEMRESQTERLRQSFEYRDVEGRLIGRAEVELDAEEKEITPKKNGDDDQEEAVRGRVLRAFVLHGEKDGVPTSVDMLAIADAGKTEVLVTSEREHSYRFYSDENRATVPPLETPLDVATFLHELGHAQQDREKRFEDVGNLYRPEKQFDDTDVVDVEKMRALVARVREAIPEAAHLLTDEHLNEIAEIDQERRQKNREYLAALGAGVKESNRQTPDQERVKELNRQTGKTLAELNRLTEDLVHTVNVLRVRDFIALPTYILERDATRRALQWARKVRAEANVDLFARHVAPNEPSAPAHDSDCERSATEGMQTSSETQSGRETDILEDLKQWLDSYGADKLRMRNPNLPDDVGITPTVGRKRDEQ